ARRCNPHGHQEEGPPRRPHPRPGPAPPRHARHLARARGDAPRRPRAPGPREEQAAGEEDHTMTPPYSDPDVMLAADGHVYVNAAALPLADRAGRRVIRCVALTPAEEEELRRRAGALAKELLGGLVAKRGGAR